jgi:hypothetical protein
MADIEKLPNDYRESLPSPGLQRDARNLLAWADRIMAGGYGEPGTLGYCNAVYSWRENYKSWRPRLPSMERATWLDDPDEDEGGGELSSTL